MEGSNPMAILNPSAMLIRSTGVADEDCASRRDPDRSVARQHKITGQGTSLTKQRREVLGHGKELESLGQSLGEPHVELLPSPKNRSNHAALVYVSRACENQYGPHRAPQQTPCVMDNVGPPDMRAAALT